MAPLAGACGLFSPPQDDAPLVVLVSWDTTRADALGCYADLAHWGTGLPAGGRPAAQTPVVDALCAGGQRFDWALAHAPTTLNSHTSLLTGLVTVAAISIGEFQLSNLIAGFLDRT